MVEGFADGPSHYIMAFKFHFDLRPGWAVEVWESGIAVWFLGHLVSVFPTEDLSVEEFVKKMEEIVKRSNFKLSGNVIAGPVTIIEPNPFYALSGYFPVKTKDEWLKRIRLD